MTPECSEVCAAVLSEARVGCLAEREGYQSELATLRKHLDSERGRHLETQATLHALLSAAPARVSSSKRGIAVPVPVQPSRTLLQVEKQCSLAELQAVQADDPEAV